MIPHPHQAMDRLLANLRPLLDTTVSLTHACGRMLREDLRADRDSPACNVSAMDGFAVRLADLDASHDSTLLIHGEVAMGREPDALPAARAMRIFTGGALPDGADTVIQREHVRESDVAITLTAGRALLHTGMHVRRQGENHAAGHTVLQRGRVIDPATIAALANFGVAHVSVARPVRVAVITTGSEVLDVDTTPQPWQVRNANGPVLAARLSSCPLAELSMQRHVTEDADALEAVLQEALAHSDMVWITGGVSVGDHDTVPGVVRTMGGEVIFHRLPVRPGKPILGAMMQGEHAGKPVLGMPGNPVSSLTMSHVFGMPLLRALSGCADVFEPGHRVQVVGYQGKALPLWWYRPVRRVDEATVALVRSMGSGDVVSAARADGYIEVPPQTTMLEHATFHAWS